MMPNYRKLISLLFIPLVLGACALLTPSQTATQLVPPTTTPAPVASPTVSGVAQSDPVLIWLAPQFDPSTPAGQLLIARIAAFEAQHPGVRINLRVKPESGAGGLLEALQAAVVAAPAVVPDLITLSPDDLQTAVGLTLIQPLPDTLVEPEHPGWYEYALPQRVLRVSHTACPSPASWRFLAYRTDLYPSPSA